MSMHTHWRLLNRLMLGLLALTLVAGTISCLDSNLFSVFPEEIDEEDDGNDGIDEPNDPDGGT